MFDRIKAKEKSKTLLAKRSFVDFLKMACVMLGFGVLTTIPSIILKQYDFVDNFYHISYALGYADFNSLKSSIIGMIVKPLAIYGVVSIVISISQLLYDAGMNRAALRMNRGDENVHVSDILRAWDMLWKYVLIALWQSVLLFLWQLPSAFVWVIAVFMIAGGVASNSVALVVFGIILVIAALIWSVCILIIKNLQYHYSYLIAEDNRNMTAYDCIKNSGNLILGHKWDLFVTRLSFIGWDILASMSMGIGNIYVSPYKYLTYAAIYEQLNGKRSNNQPVKEKEKVEVEDYGERMIEFLSGEFAGTSLPITSGEDICIGRDPQRANIVVSNANTNISGLHCIIRYDEYSKIYVVTDYSLNGTYLNNVRLMPKKSTPAFKGSVVKLADGSILLRLS